MADKSTKEAVLTLLKSLGEPRSIVEINQLMGGSIAERTLRRWLVTWVVEGKLKRTGAKRSTRYQFISSSSGTPEPGFLKGLDTQIKTQVLKQIRDLWTHTSTALEGNTLTLGDTHFLLEQGLTISGKAIRDHNEVIGHARAIDLIYDCLEKPLSKKVVFELHKAIQTEVVGDIYKVNGAWKQEINGTYVVTADNKQTFIEYAHPKDVNVLMQEVISEINAVGFTADDFDGAVEVYAKIHVGIVHIHPFWDGNGRIARLIANIPLLKMGLPPLVIPVESRREYIQLLADYELKSGQLTQAKGVWPKPDHLKAFKQFCQSCYQQTRKILAPYL